MAQQYEEKNDNEKENAHFFSKLKFEREQEGERQSKK